MQHLRVLPAPGQESVWDYPRPPRLEPTSRHIRVVFHDVVIADTCRAWRVIETSHPPVYYIPPGAVRRDLLVPSDLRTFCEWKGEAYHATVRVGDREAVDAIWFYPVPTVPFTSIRNHYAFHPALMDVCTVDGEVVRPQTGSFYGGWITSDIVGPFKGEPGTEGW